MGSGASSAVPAADAPVERRSDGVSVYAVKTALAPPVKPNTMARLAICEDELQLLDSPRGSAEVDNAAVLACFDYRAIPSWSITGKQFSFKFWPAAHERFVRVREPEPEPEPELADRPSARGGDAATITGLLEVTLATLQAKQISAVLREHCYKKADETRRLKSTLDAASFGALLAEVRQSGLPRINALCAGQAVNADPDDPRLQAFLETGELVVLQIAIQMPNLF